MVFRPLNTLPHPNLDHIPMNRLNHYQYLQRLSEFWNLWSKEYIQTLQIRKKWQSTQPNVKVGQIVLISEDNQPPTKWQLGKIINVYPGPDQLIRAADVCCLERPKEPAKREATQMITLRRPIHKLSLIPILDNNETSIN